MDMEDRRRKNPGANAVHGLPDDVLASIFLRLPSLSHLLRAACACKRWRHVIADGSFLRAFRDLRVPSLAAGHFHVYRHKYGPRPPGCDPEFVPSLSSPLKAADDVGAPRRLSFDFLPQRPGDLPEWEIADRRGAIYLLLNEGTDATPFRFPDLVVCEPLSRRYTVVPPPADLHGCRCIGAFLLNGGSGGDKSPGRGFVTLSRFGVLCAVFRYGVARACVFSSGSGGWTIARCSADCGMELLPGLHTVFFAGESRRYVHWVSTDDDRVLTLDKDSAEFSSFYLPVPDPDGRLRWGRHGVRVVHRNRGPVCVLCLVQERLMVFVQEEETGGWAMEAEVLLFAATCTLPGYKEWYFQRPGRFISEAEGVVVMAPWEEAWHISANLETMEFKRTAGGMAYPYVLTWPPAGLTSFVDDFST